MLMYRTNIIKYQHTDEVLMDASCFHERADELLEALQDAIEEANTENEVQTDLIDGVLTVTLKRDGEFVLNKHEPTCQIWMSSPESGSSKYKYNEDDDEWYNSAGESFKEKISEELAQLAGIDVEF